jgi:hypothetical protein
MNSGAPYAAVVGAPFMGTPHGGYVHRNATSGLQEVKKSNLVATTDPAVGDDTDDGYAVGSQWINVSSGSVFTCTNAAAGAANWTLLGGGSGVGVPAGTGTEIQYRVNATTFGAVAGSSWDATTLTLPKTNFSGVIGLAAGTAAAPSLCFSADTDTGIYWNSANKIGVTVAGSEMFTISASSGITPTTGSTYGLGSGSLSWLVGLFDRINANTAGNNKTVFNMSSAGTYYGAIMVDPAGVASGAWSLGYSAATTNAYGTPVLTWTGAGNVGIGATTPGAKLHILGSPNGATSLATAASDASLRIDYAGNPTATVMNFGFIQAGGGSYSYIQPSNAAGSVAYHLCLAPYGGNVGIGTAAPAYRLVVNAPASTSVPAFAVQRESDSSYRFVINTYGNVAIAADAITDISTLNCTLSVRAASLDKTILRIIPAGTGHTGNLLAIDEAATATTKFVVTPACRLGIGTSTPGALLHMQSSGIYAELYCFTTAGSGSYANLLFGDSTTLTYYGGVQRFSNSHATYPGRMLVFNPSKTILLSTENASLPTRADLLIDSSGNVGIGTAGPDAKLDVLSTTEQLRLTYSDGSVYSTFYTASNGSLNVTASGRQMIFTATYAGGNAAYDFRNITSNAAGVRTDLNLPVFNGNAGLTLRIIGNSYDANLYSGHIFTGQNGGQLLFSASDIGYGGGVHMRLDYAGNLGVGTGAALASARLHVISTTEQMRLGYDATKYASFTVDNSGDMTIAPSGANLAITADVDVPSDKAFYLGAPATDGTWRITRSGNNLLMERRESGAYVTKQTIAA